MSRRAALAALLLSVTKDLTPGDVHVPNTNWASARSRKRRLAQELRKALGDAGLYVGRPLTPESDAQLREWWREWVGARGAALDDNLHVTVVHSRVSIPWTPDRNLATVPRSQFLGFETLGKDRAMVLRFRAPALQARWKAARREGAVWDHPSYAPHLTLFYLGAGYDSTEYRDGKYPPLPPFDLVFAPEVSGPLSEDVFKWDSVEGLLASQDCLESLAEAVHNSWMEHQANRDTPHCVPYGELSEASKQVDRDAVRAVLSGVTALGFGFTKVL